MEAKLLQNHSDLSKKIRRATSEEVKEIKDDLTSPQVGTTDVAKLKKFSGSKFILIQQNPNTNSAWSNLVSEGYEVFQIILSLPGSRYGRYVGVLVNGEVYIYLTK